MSTLPTSFVSVGTTHGCETRMDNRIDENGNQVNVIAPNNMKSVMIHMAVSEEAIMRGKEHVQGELARHAPLAWEDFWRINGMKDGETWVEVFDRWEKDGLFIGGDRPAPIPSEFTIPDMRPGLRRCFLREGSQYVQAWLHHTFQAHDDQKIYALVETCIGGIGVVSIAAVAKIEPWREPAPTEVSHGST